MQKFVLRQSPHHPCFWFHEWLSVLTHSSSFYPLLCGGVGCATKNCQLLNFTHFFMQRCLILIYLCFYTLVHWNRSTILAFSPFMPRLLDSRVRAISKDLHSYQQHYYTYMADVAPDTSFSYVVLIECRFMAPSGATGTNQTFFIGSLCLAP